MKEYEETIARLHEKFLKYNDHNNETVTNHRAFQDKVIDQAVTNRNIKFFLFLQSFRLKILLHFYHEAQPRASMFSAFRVVP